MTAATEMRGLQDMAFWISNAASVLARPLHAAALGDRTMADVYQWAHGIDADVPERIISAHPAAVSGGWLGPLREVQRPGRTADSIRMFVTRALGWLADPAVAAATSPGPGEGFNVAEFALSQDTLYMIGSGREEAPIAPLFRAFAEHVHAGASLIGSLGPHGRLDPPLLMALDEVTQICPVPLPLWMADSAGKGILIVAVCHGLAQLRARWDNSGAQAIWDTAGIKVVLDGVTDADTLEDLSRLCGEVALRAWAKTRDEYGRRSRTRTYEVVRVMPPELLRMLPDRRALIIRGNLSPVVVRLRMAWRRVDYLLATTSWIPANRKEVCYQLPPNPLPGRAEMTLPTGKRDAQSRPNRENDPDDEPGHLAPSRPRPSHVSRSTHDAPAPPWRGGNTDVPRPRRPWDPPVSSGDRR